MPPRGITRRRSTASAIFAVLMTLLNVLVLMARGARRWTTVTGAAEYSKFSTRVIRQRIADGDLPAYYPKRSRLLRIDLDDVDKLIEGSGRSPSAHLGEKDSQ